jgi:hypothetical protein
MKLRSMKRILSVLLSCGVSFALQAQTSAASQAKSDVSDTPSPQQRDLLRQPEALEKKSQLEERYQKRVDELATRILGPTGFLASSVEVVFADPEALQSADGTESAEGLLTYLPQDWSAAQVGSPDDLRLEALNVRVYVRSDINSERERLLKKTLEQSFSSLAMNLKFERGNAVAFNDSPTKDEASRSPASVDGSDAAKPDTMKPETSHLRDLGPYALAAGVLLGLVAMALTLLAGLKSFSSSLSQAASTLAGGMARSSDSKLDLKSSSEPALTSSSGEESPDTEDFSRTAHSLESLILTRRAHTEDVLSSENDAQLAHLVESLGLMSEEARLGLREILGTRSSLFESLSADKLPSSKDSRTWTASLVKRILARDLVSENPITKSIDPVDLKSFRKLRGEQLGQFVGSVLEQSDSRLVAGLSEILDTHQIQDFVENSSSEEWTRLVGLIEQSPNDKIALESDQLERLKASIPRGDGASSAAAGGTRASTQRVLAGLLVAQKKLILDAETRNLRLLCEKLPQMRPSLESRYWGLAALARVPEPVLVTWLTRLDNRLLAALLHFSQSSEELTLWARLESLLPEGMRKTIVLDYYKKMSTQNSSKELQQWSGVLRANIETLRAQHTEGRFELLRPQQQDEVAHASESEAA